MKDWFTRLLVHPITVRFVLRVAIPVVTTIYPFHLPKFIRVLRLLAYLNALTGIWCLTRALDNAGTVWGWVDIASALMNFWVARRCWRLHLHHRARFDAYHREVIQKDIVPRMLQAIDGLRQTIPLAMAANTRVNRDAEEHE